MLAAESFIDATTRKLIRLVLKDDAGPYIDIEGGLRTFLKDVVGATVVETVDQTQGIKLVVFAYPHKTEGNCLYGSKRPSLERRARHLQLSAPTYSVAKQWDSWIKAWCRGQQQSGEEEAQEPIKPTSQGRRRRLLVLVNPLSGRRQSHHIYTSVVAPMLQQADVEHEVVVTTHTQHAKDILQKLDVEAFDGVVAIGGDGLLSEVINGLYSQDPENRRALSKLPLAIVNGGTGNGLSTSLLHHNTEAFNPISATFLLLKAKSTLPADLSLVETADGQRHLSFLSLSFGLIADVDLESEVIRWVGNLRMDLFSLYSILRLRTYRAHFSFLPCEEGGTPPAEVVELPPLHMPLSEKEGWVGIEDDFLMILISHVSHIAASVHSSPGKKIGDGTFQILILRQQPSLSRLRLISLFLALEHGGHVAVDEAEVYHARAYRLEPLTEQGRYSLDGEAIPYGNVQGRVLPHAIQLLGDL